MGRKGLGTRGAVRVVRPNGTRLGAQADIVGDRERLVGIGMIAVFGACVIFGATRLFLTLSTGRPTPWWANVAAALVVSAIFLWYRRRRETRSKAAVHGTAIAATLALLVPVAYGMHSTLWWLSLVGFAMVLLGRRGEAVVWAIVMPGIVLLASLFESNVMIAGSAEEDRFETVLARTGFAVLVTFMAAAFRRVAERRALALRASEERYRLLFQRAPVGVFHCDQALQLTHCNDRLVDILKVSRDRLLGIRIGDLRDARLLPALRGALAGSSSEYEGPFEAGSEVGSLTLSVRTAPLVGEDGAVIGAIGIVEDVTERRRMETRLQRAHDELEERVRERTAALSHSEEKYRLLFERNLAGVLRGTADGQLLDCNDACARIFGYPSRTEMLGSSELRLYETTAQREEIFARLRRDGQLVNHERSIQRRDGATRWVLENLSLSADTVEGTLIDVTERRALEERLRQAQRLETVGALAGGLAHDLNNILAIVQMHTSLLARQLVAPSELAGVEEISDATRKASSLTRQLLSFARKQILQPRLVDLNEIVSSTVKMIKRIIGENIEVVEEPGEQLWPVRVDPIQAEQIVLNLAVNARDAMPRGGVLTVRTKNVQCDGRDDVLLAVRDTGVGMSETVLAHVFEPFFTTKSEGTGLGLATVHGIVTQSGGTISVQSEMGSGTEFDVYLPACRTDRVLERPPISTRTTERGHETVLIVEDQAPLRRVIAKSLAAHGYTTLEASDAREALAVAAKHTGKIDLLLSDVVMPGMSGKQLAERVRETRPTTKVLFISGYLGEGAADGEGLGKALLPKPFSETELLAKVRELLD